MRSDRRPSQLAAEQRYAASGKRPPRVLIGVKLTEKEAAKLDQLRGTTPRAEYLRRCAGLHKEEMKMNTQINQAQQIVDQNKANAAQIMDALVGYGIEPNDQNWETGTTTWELPDGSKIVISGPSVEVLPE